MSLSELDRVRSIALALPEVSERLSHGAPCFSAPTPGASGVFGDWVGVYLDTRDDLAVDWGEVAAIVEDAYRLRAPKRLIAQLDGM